MDILKSSEYINEKLNIKPVTKTRLSDMSIEPTHDKNIQDFINVCNLKYNRASQRYDSNRGVIITDEILIDGKFPIKFGDIKGGFICNYCETLVSLEGAPIHSQSFECTHCGNLKSLEGSPKTVDGLFNCSNCKNLESFNGAPKSIGSLLAVGTTVKTLEGLPQRIDGYVDCSMSKNIESTKGAPQYIGGDFDLHGCENLKRLEDSPTYVGGDFNLKDCPNILSGEKKNLPQKVNGEIIWNI